MKCLSVTFFFGIIILLFSLQVGMSSCTKEKIEYETIVKIQHDTVIKKTDTALTVQLLTANSWKLQEYIGNEGNNKVSYVRGGSGNTINHDNEYIFFRADNTGGYYDPNANVTNALTWNFANTSNTKIIYTVNFPTGATVITWDHIFYKNGSLVYDQYYTQGTMNSHTQNIRIPR